MVPQFLDFELLSNKSKLFDHEIQTLSNCGSLRVVSFDATKLGMMGPSGEHIGIERRDEIVKAKVRLAVHPIREQLTVAESCGRVWGGSCVMSIEHRIFLTYLLVCYCSIGLVPFLTIPITAQLTYRLEMRR